MPTIYCYQSFQTHDAQILIIEYTCVGMISLINVCGEGKVCVCVGVCACVFVCVCVSVPMCVCVCVCVGMYVCIYVLKYILFCIFYLSFSLTFRKAAWPTHGTHRYSKSLLPKTILLFNLLT